MLRPTTAFRMSEWNSATIANTNLKVSISQRYHPVAMPNEHLCFCLAYSIVSSKCPCYTSYLSILCTLWTETYRYISHVPPEAVFSTALDKLCCLSVMLCCLAFLSKHLIKSYTNMWLYCASKNASCEFQWYSTTSSDFPTSVSCTTIWSHSHSPKKICSVLYM